MQRISAQHWWLAGLFVAALHAAAVWAVLGPPPTAMNTATLSGHAVIQGALIRPVMPAPAVQPASEAPEPERAIPPAAPPAPQAPSQASPVAAATPATPGPTVQAISADSPPSNTESAAAAEAVTVIPPRLDAAQHHNPAPPYPARSRRLREEGTVVLELWVLPDGRAGEVQVAVSSGHARLDAAAREAVRHWRYTAARQGGQPIAWRYRQPVVFSLNP